ncbi:MAG: ATP synthase F1 subunit gamma [Bacteroidota bacterium]
MANLKEVRIRIASVQSTQKITSAMKMVSASKLRRAQNAIVKLRPYSSKLNEILESISENNDSNNENVFGVQRPIEHVTLVLISSNRGMCGSFNSNVIKMGLQIIHEKYADQYKNGNLSLITIGKRVTEYFVKREYPVIHSDIVLTENPNYDRATEVSNLLMNSFKKKKTDSIEIIYNQFKNAATQILINEQFLPIKQKEQTGKKSNTEYIFEPSKEIIIEELVPKILKLQFYKSILDSIASEHGARMTAMHKATDNAGEMIKSLKLSYNKARQAAITNEISEIVSGANALKG